MKKLMTVLASAATALFALGAANGQEVVTEPLNATSFEGLSVGKGILPGGQLDLEKADDGTTDHTYWYMKDPGEDNGTVVSNETANASSRPDWFDGEDNDTMLALDTSSPLFRTVKADAVTEDEEGVHWSAGEAIGDGIYLDTLVKFTAADDVFGDDALAAGDKIAISYVEREEETTTTEVEGVSQTVVTVPALTNFVIRAGGIVDGEFGAVNYIAAVPAGFKKDAWHRLTVRAIADVGDGQAGFIVYLDGNMEKALAYDTNVDAGFAKVSGTYAEKYYNDNIHAIYPSAVNVGDNKTTISAVSFSGTGAIDDVVFTKAKPSFIVESPKVTFTWDEDVTELTIGETTLTDDQLAAKSLIVDLVGTTISVEATVASGKAARYATTGEGASWDATNGQFTGLVAGDSCSISAIVPAFEVGGIPYTTDELTTVLDLAEAGTQASPVTVKLVANCNQLISLGEGEYDPEDAAYVVLDLNGHDIQGGESDDFSVINNGVNLTIINSGSAASVKVPTYEQASGVLLAGLGFTTIEAGTYEGTVIAIPDDEEEGTVSTMLIKGGSFLDAAYVEESVFYLAGFVQSGLAVTYDSATQYVQVGGGTPQPTTYTLTVTDNANATTSITINEQLAETGAEIEDDDVIVITATPNSGYEYASAPDGWTLSEGAITKTITVDGEDVEVTIPAPTEIVIGTYTVTVTPTENAEYSAVYTVEGNEVAFVSDVATVVSGKSITITAAPAEDYEYATTPDGWTAGQNGVITIVVSEAGTVVIPEPTEKQQSDYPSYIDENVAYKSAYDTWKTNNNVAAGDNKYEAAFLLNIAPGAEDQTLEPASITIADGKVVITANKNLGTVNGKVYVKTATTLAGLKSAEWVAATLDDAKAINVTPDSTDEAGFYQIKVDF